jgi:DNA repair exonuclease SbcCD ATPase subunit
MPDKIEGTTQDSPERQTSSSDKESTSKTYTEDEVKKFKSDALAEAGRKHKEELTSIAKERDELKLKLSELQSNVEDTKADYEKTIKRVKELEDDLETAIGDSADLKEIQSIKRKLREAETQLESDYKAKAKALKAKEEELNNKHKEFDSTVEEIKASKFEVDVVKVSEEYENSDANRLKALCEKAGKKSRLEIEDLASVLWTKKSEQTTMPTDSGTAPGVRGFTKESIARMSIEDYKKNYDAIQEAVRAGKIK